MVFAVATARASDRYTRLLAPLQICAEGERQLGLSERGAARAMLCLTNYARKQLGLQPLSENDALDRIGQMKVRANLACRDFSHTPCGQPFGRAFAPYSAGATSYLIGENIAWGTGRYSTPREIMRLWLESDEHRANILCARFNEIGIGYLPHANFLGYQGVTLWSQEFGFRTTAATSGATRTT